MSEYLNFTSQNIAWFNNRRNDETLIVRPKFQRNLVWTDKQRSYLIDSILNGFPIPELYIQEKVDSTGKTMFIVVDGQQRITSFLKFIDNEFPLDRNETSDEWADLYFNDLSPDNKKKFYGYKFIVRELPDMDESELRSIFKRINKNNVALNSQELRQSTYTGEFIQAINSIAEKKYWQELGIFTPAKVRRMLDAEYISELAVAVLNGHQNKKDNLDKYYALYEENFDYASELEEIFDDTGKEILAILPELRRTRWKNLTDFYTLFLVIGQYKDAIPFSSDERRELGNKLQIFSSSITKLLSFIENNENEDEAFFPEEENEKLFRQYASGVRASTDLNNRRNRFESLTKFLEKELIFLNR